MTTHAGLPDLFGRATVVMGGHAGLREGMQLLRGYSASFREEVTDSADGAKACLEAFGERVSAHFAAEEGPDYFGTFADESLSLLQGITQLKLEHTELSRLLAALRDFQDIELRPVEFSRALDAFLESFVAHERREHALLQDFFTAGDSELPAQR